MVGEWLEADLFCVVFFFFPFPSPESARLVAITEEPQSEYLCEYTSWIHRIFKHLLGVLLACFCLDWLPLPYLGSAGNLLWEWNGCFWGWFWLIGSIFAILCRMSHEPLWISSRCYLNNPVSFLGPWSLSSSYGTLNSCDFCVCLTKRYDLQYFVEQMLWIWHLDCVSACGCGNLASVASGLVAISWSKRLVWAKFTCYRQWIPPLLLSLVQKKPKKQNKKIQLGCAWILEIKMCFLLPPLSTSSVSLTAVLWFWSLWRERGRNQIIVTNRVALHLSLLFDLCMQRIPAEMCAASRCFNYCGGPHHGQ